MRKGLALARTGELNRLGREADADRGRALERHRRTVQQGSDLGRRRADRFRVRRDNRARALGYRDVEDLLRRRYVLDGATVAELALALGAAETTVISEMNRLGIPRRPLDHRLAHGRQALAAERAQAAAKLHARARERGFPNLRSYLGARHHRQRWPRRLIADELDVSIPVVARLMRTEGVPGLRGVSVAKARAGPAG
jgi:hypothetical protein